MFRETVSSEDGTYFVSGIVPGVDEVTAELQGFKKLGLKDRYAAMTRSAKTAAPPSAALNGSTGIRTIHLPR